MAVNASSKPSRREPIPQKRRTAPTTTTHTSTQRSRNTRCGASALPDSATFGGASAVAIAPSLRSEPSTTAFGPRSARGEGSSRQNVHMSIVLHDPTTYSHGFPYEAFRKFRDNEPISHHDHPGWERGYWAVVRHADVQQVSRDWNTFQNAPIRSFRTPGGSVKTTTRVRRSS